MAVVMVNGRVAFPRIDLVAHRATHLSFSCHLPWTSKVADAFSDLVDEDGTFWSVTPYRRSATDHLLLEHAHVSRGSSREIGIFVDYDVSPRRSVPKALRRPTDLLDRLSRLPDPCALRCHVDFEVEASSTDRVRPFFPLPARLGQEGSELPMDEIRGIRGTKGQPNDSDQVEYTFILDRPTNEEIYLYVTFSLVAPITDQTPGEVLSFASNVFASMIFIG